MVWSLCPSSSGVEEDKYMRQVRKGKRMDKLVFLYVSTLRRKNYKDMKRASLFFFRSLPYLIAIGYTSQCNISFIYAKYADICNTAYPAGMRVVRNSTYLLVPQDVLFCSVIECRKFLFELCEGDLIRMLSSSGQFLSLFLGTLIRLLQIRVGKLAESYKSCPITTVPSLLNCLRTSQWTKITHQQPSSAQIDRACYQNSYSY